MSINRDYQRVRIKELDAAKDEVVPTHTMDDTLVGKVDFDYSTRSPKDYVVSGPISGRGAGPGREFLTADDAEAWGREHFGNRFKARIFGSERGGRWAILISLLGEPG